MLGFTTAQGDGFIGNPAINIQENSHGLDKYYPFGPACVVNGKKIETFVTCSKTGTVTSEILRGALKKMMEHLHLTAPKQNHFFCWMGMEAAFSSLSLTTSLRRRRNGPFALECLMALMYGRLVIPLNRMVPLK